MSSSSAAPHAERRFEELLSLLPHLVYEARVNLGAHGKTTFLYVSESGAAAFEWAPASRDPHVYRAEDFVAMVHPDDLALARELWLGRSRELAPFSHQYRVVLPKAGLRWVESRARPTLEADGQVLWRGVITDITDLRETQARLARTVDDLKRAERLARMGSWSWDVRADRVFWSEGMDVLFKRNTQGVPADIAAMAQHFTPESFGTIEQAAARCLETGAPYVIELDAVAADGTRFPTIARGQAARDDAGAIVSLFGTLQDLTESHRLTEALRLEKERLSLATRASGVGIWELDLQRMEVLWDERLDEIFAGAAPHFRSNVPPNTYGGSFEHYLETLHPDDVSIVVAAARDAQAGAGTIDCEFRIRGGGGTWRRLRSFGRVLAGPDGRPARIVGTNWDITAEHDAAEQMRAARDAAEAAERAKGEFLAVMSHEIRSPMNAVLGMVRLALQTELTPKQHNYLSKIDLSAKALIVILNDILDFSKIEARKLRLEETEFSLESVLESVAAVTAVKAEEKGLEIAFDLAPGLPERLMGDPLRLGQVLINLVNNAVKFTEQGEVVISIAPQADAAGVAQLRFSVRDTGIGLSADQLDELFLPFTQADTQTTRQYGGTGLGLAISKQLVETMGGRIWATGVPGRGSTFTFTVPVRTPRVAVTPTSSRQTMPGALRGRRVLVVDDNASAREILESMVRRFGMETGASDSGPAALATLQAAASHGRPFDLVLMDWRMPGMDGLEAARRIKADPELERTPAVLMVTAFGREEVLQRAVRLRLEGVLIKPVTESVLFNTIVEALGDRRVAPDPPVTPALPARSAVAGVERLAGRCALVVDDNALNREVATDFLLAAGMRVDAAVHGGEALDRLRTQRYDVVLMDVHMPVMDGLAATREIRLSGGPAARVPIVALTAQAQAADREASLAAGMNAHLTKPIDESSLYDTLVRLLHGASDTSSAHAPSHADAYASASAHADANANANTNTSASTDGDVSANASARANANAAVSMPVDSAPAWPIALPGIDLDAALARLGGKRERVMRLLRGFVRDFADAPAQLAADLAARRRAPIALLAHTVKSAAGYLAASDLVSAAHQLEVAARHGEDEAMAERGLVFRGYLESVLAGLDSLFAQPQPWPADGRSAQGSAHASATGDRPAEPASAPGSTGAPGGTAAADETIARLLAAAAPLVTRGDYASLALLDELSVRLAGTPHAALAAAARDAFEEVELQSAAAALDRLRAALGLAASPEEAV